MATLIKSEFAGEVTWLGHVPDEDDALRASPRQTLELDFDGAAGERHAGRERESCVRMTMLYPKGTRVRNVRQLSVLSQEELDGIAADIGLEALDPSWLGASLVLRGIPDFTHVPPASRLVLPSGLVLTIDTENLPCIYPAREIESDRPGHGKAFKSAARGRRGVTAWVERPGSISLADQAALFVPSQRAWAP